MILKFYVFVNLPLPEVWSEEGPVGEDDVPPLFRVQSNVSFLSCVKPHIELSKLHAVANEKENKLKHEGETVDSTKSIDTYSFMLISK